MKAKKSALFVNEEDVEVSGVGASLAKRQGTVSDSRFFALSSPP